MSKILRDISLRDFGASLNTVESYTNESSYGKIGLYEAVNKQKCTHLGMFLASEERVFRMWVFKKMFTPYEQEEKFSDESVYEDDTCKFVMIKEMIELPDGDLLIGFQDADSDNLYLEYYKLSEIRLDYCQSDKERLEDDFDE